VKIGCSICYDLRFPELYGALVERGAQILVMVAAMSKVHGAPHLEVLLRARAIETQAYVVAATQCGIYGSSDNELAGHSMVVDPWGVVIGSLGDEPGYLNLELDSGSPGKQGVACCLGRARDVRVPFDAPSEVEPSS